MSFISSLCPSASLVHLLHSLSLPHKSQVESETQLQKKCFPGMSPAAEWVFSNGIPNFELFFSWSPGLVVTQVVKGWPARWSSRWQAMQRLWWPMVRRSRRPPRWWRPPSAHKARRCPRWDLAKGTFQCLSFRCQSCGTWKVGGVDNAEKNIFGTWRASLAGNFGSHTRLYMQVSAIMVNFNFEI